MRGKREESPQRITQSQIPPSYFNTEERDFTEIIHEYDNRHMLNYPAKREAGRTRWII